MIAYPNTYFLLKIHEGFCFLGDLLQMLLQKTKLKPG